MEVGFFTFLYSESPHTTSVHIDMKIIRLVNCSSSQFILLIILWISTRTWNTMNTGNFDLSNSIDLPSIRNSSRNWEVLLSPLKFVLFPIHHWITDVTLFFQDLILNLRIRKLLPLKVMLSWHRTKMSFYTCQQICKTPWISDWSSISLCDVSSNCFKSSFLLVQDRM